MWPTTVAVANVRSPQLPFLVILRVVLPDQAQWLSFCAGTPSCQPAKSPFINFCRGSTSVATIRLQTKCCRVGTRSLLCLFDWQCRQWRSWQPPPAAAFTAGRFWSQSHQLLVAAVGDMMAALWPTFKQLHFWIGKCLQNGTRWQRRFVWGLARVFWCEIKKEQEGFCPYGGYLPRT